jgi:hypothetical protein
MDRTEELPPRDHNKPPTTLDLLKQDLQTTYGNELAKITPIAERANAAPATIASDDDLAVWAKVGVDASKLWKQLDAARLNEKRPVTKAVDDFFEEIARLSRIATVANQKATDWQRKKAAKARAEQEAEAQRLRDEAERKRLEAEFESDGSSASVTTGEAAALEIQATTATQPQSAADLTRVRTADGITATTRTTWEFEIVDYAKVDLNALRLFIKRDAVETAIRKIVATQKGDTKIEGVRVFEKETAQFRG